MGTGILNVNNSNFASNQAGYTGGAIMNDGTLKVTDSTFSDNSVTEFESSQGGAIYNFGGEIEITNSTFVGNTAGPGGGGIFNVGTVSISNSTFSGNGATDGGAIYNLSGSSLTVRNSPFSLSIATDTGGALFNAQGATLVVTGCILANSAGGDCASNPALSISNGGYNIADDASCGFGTSTGASDQTIGDNVNPLLATSIPQDNGGPTETIALQSTSPAIAAIPAADCPATDQRGYKRPAPGQTACDIGAFEYGAVAPNSTPTATQTPKPTATPTTAPTRRPTPRPVPGVYVTPTILDFAPQTVGTESASQSITVINDQLDSITLRGSIGGTDPGDFILTRATTCKATLSAHSECAISLAFKPEASGGRHATLTLTDSPDPHSPHKVALDGTGLIASPTPTRTPTHTPTRTPSRTPSHTPTATPTRTATRTGTRTATRTPTRTATRTPTRTASRTPTRTASAKPSHTPTATPTRTATRTGTRTPTRTPSRTPTAKAT